MRYLYSLLLSLLLPLLLLRMLWRSRRAPAYRRRLAERLGFFAAPEDPRPLIWVHAVSLGETLAARPLLERILEELPQYQLAVTTTTPTGSEQLRRLFGGRVFHVYAPWDTPGSVRRCLARLRPQLLVIMETELWPNLLQHCARRGCPVMLANARLSQRSAEGYRRFGSVSRRMLAQLDAIAAQSDADARRFRDLGAPNDRVQILGSLKYDLRLEDELREEAAALRRDWGLQERPVLIVASTHEAEEALALQAFAALRGAGAPQALLILVPRHPERFDGVADLCSAAGWKVLRRSARVAPEPDTDILLLDSVGELLLFYGIADLAVLGGTFLERGGHNPLEPAAWSLPVLCGPSLFNFEQIAGQLGDVGALEIVHDAPQLAQRAGELLADAGERRRRGAAGLAVVEANRGALEHLFQQLRALLPEGRPEDAAPLPVMDLGRRQQAPRPGRN